MRTLRFLPIFLALPAAAQDAQIEFQTFEGDGFDTWHETGTAFGKAPTAGGQGSMAGRINGYAQESLAASFAEGDAGVGSLTSPDFTIDLPYISFLVGGGSERGATAVQLLVGEEVVREEVGANDKLLRPRTWDVSTLKGTRARIRLIDSSANPGGFLMADHIVFTTDPNTIFPIATRSGQPFNPGLVSSDVIPGITVPDGTEVGIFATFQDHQVYSPTALCIDESGRLLVTETHRFRFGIPDNRDHRYWHADDIASLTVEDRLEMHRKWDKNYPLAEMSAKSEMIRLLVDKDGDGKADESKVFAGDFNDPLDGTAAGIYSYNGEVYFACIPHIWKLRDKDSDGVADERQKLFSGFGIRVSLSGHDVNGFALGPDGRLYGSIGDRAMNLTTAEGIALPYTDQGTVFRFDPDGSNFEVVHAGLRNPKEVAFDRFGNCLSVDNNSDQGDKARVVYIMDGADSGWRTDHQNLHTFHREIGYENRPINQWMQERQWDIHHPGQPAFMLPPIDTLTSGPSGLTYQPGTGYTLGCADNFLVCDFRGGAAASGIWAFGVETAGAGLRMTNPRKFNWGAAVTDAEFGYDGRLYVTDFIDGWQSHDDGRVYTLSTPQSVQDPTTRQVASLFQEGFAQRPALELFNLMAHPDQRVRLRAQIALADRPEAVPFFINATEQTAERMQRLHGVWGLWIRARRQHSEASTNQLLKLLGDPDEEVRAQAARALGEAPLQDRGRLMNSLQDSFPRVRAFAALSLTRLRCPEAFNAILVLLAENADQDPYLRHAGVMALLGAATEAQIAALHSHPNKSIRMAAVIALRRLHSPELVRFFFEQEHPEIADEAIRAVHDVPIEAARPAVAALLDEYVSGGTARPLSRMMLRRLLHSAFRLGGPENVERLMRVAANEALDENERVEALRLLSVWTNPPRADQSLGRHAPLPPRPLAGIKGALEAGIVPLLALKGEVLASAIALVTDYDLSIDSLDEAGLTRLISSESLGEGARIRALELLAKRDFDTLADTLLTLTGDANSQLASRALELLAAKAPDRALDPATKAIASSDVSAAQRAWLVFAGLPGEPAAALIAKGVQDLIDGRLDPGVALEVIDAAGLREDEEVRKALEAYLQGLPADDPLAAFRIALKGGDVTRGDAIYHTHPAAQCMRCHRIDQGHAEGGDAGPNLIGIGKRHDAAYFLESLIVPNATVAPGYGIITLTFENGQSKSGLLVAETDETIDLLEGSDLWRIKKSDLKERSKPVSAMAPPMGAVLTKREIRDLVAWLGSLQEGTPPAPPEREIKEFVPSAPTPPEPLPAPVPNATPESAPTPAPQAQPDPASAPEPAPTPAPEPAPAAAADPPSPNAAIDSKIMEQGRLIYVLCAGCHGPQGEGMPQLGPPLAKSEWVNGPHQNLVRIQLRGLQDTISVAGRTYVLGSDIPSTGMLELSYQTDEQIAAVLTYIRNSFGNQAPAVTPAMVAEFRSEARQGPLKVADLIPPPALPTASALPAGASPALPRSSSGVDLKTLLIVGVVILWCGICLIPVIRRFAVKEA